MYTSAEQFHHARLNAKPKADAGKRLFIDLDVCANGECPQCVIKCSYFYREGNNGIFSVAELATFVLVCRKCMEPHCINACPVDALEQQEDKGRLIVRHGMRCISCKSCSLACPYGTIYPENLPHLAHNCDFCLDRRDKKNEPLCIKTCPLGALKLAPGNMEMDENTFLVGDNLIVHSTHWRYEKA
jgi:Fe-S-cluster-containing dehydrogenase component